MTEMKVKNAEEGCDFGQRAECSNIEKIQGMIATMNEGDCAYCAVGHRVQVTRHPPQVQALDRSVVQENMTAVAHHAILESQEQIPTDVANVADFRVSRTNLYATKINTAVAGAAQLRRISCTR